MIVPMLAAVQAEAPAADAGDITVVARLKKIRVSAQTDAQGRVTRCEVSVSSGDPALDAQACEATRACAAAQVKAGDPMAECVDRRLVAFVTEQRDRRGTNDAHD